MDASVQTVPGSTSAAQLLAEATRTLTAAGVGTPRLDAEVLLAAACGVDRAALYAGVHDALPAQRERDFRGMLQRRCARQPLQYITGRQEFWSLDFTLTPDVLIPRPETERVVELTLAAVRRDFPSEERLTLCDVGTGSGCLAVALARELPHARIWAIDVSAPALAVAEGNARRHGVGGRVRFVHSDLFENVEMRRFEVIVSNPPYVTAAELARLQPELRCEPRRALEAGATGLEVIARLLMEAQARLVDGGWIFIEIGSEQAAAVTALATAAELKAISVVPDYAGLPRVLVARR